MINTAEKIGVGDIARRGIDAAHINDGTISENDSRRIGEVDETVRKQGAINLGRVGPEDTIENSRAGTGLNELDQFVNTNVERLIINYAVVAGMDKEVATLTNERHVAIYDLLSDDVGTGRRGG